MRFITLQQVGEEEITFPVHRLLWLKPRPRDKKWTDVRLDDGTCFTAVESRKEIIAIVNGKRSAAKTAGK
jgi:hypothetical protein